MRAWPSLLVLAALASADARFADAQGFSGKHGITCVSCHLPDAAPFEEASVRLDGLPAAWDLDGSYPLQISVSGGPPANPAPGTPQAGFDLETDLGALAEGPGMDGLLRFPGPQEATYTGVGTFRRDWAVVWTAPNLSRAPREANFWIAGLAANGNHVMNGPDTAGERGDRAATAFFAVPPSEAVERAWREQPLAPPVLKAYEPPPDGGPSTLFGAVPDFADGAEVRIDEAEWQGAIGAPSFFLQLPPWAPGPHAIEARTVWMDRASEPTRVEFEAPGAAGNAAAVDASKGGWAVAWWLLILAALLLVPFVLKIRK